MGLSKAIIAIKGNCIDKLGKIVSILNYMEDDNIFDKLSQTVKFKNGWTILPDEEMVFVTEDDLLSQLSEDLGTEIFSFIVQSTSATYGFSNFNASKNRLFLAQDGEIVENSGDKLKAEMELNINENVSAGDILKVAKLVGIDLVY